LENLSERDKLNNKVHEQEPGSCGLWHEPSSLYQCWQLTAWGKLSAVAGRPPLLLPSCKKLEFRLSALMDSDLAWVNGKSGRQNWCDADAFKRSIISWAACGKMRMCRC